MVAIESQHKNRSDIGGAESQEESHIDVIGYLTRTSDDVVGDKCWTVMLKCQSHKCFRTKTCFFICNKYYNNG